MTPNQDQTLRDCAAMVAQRNLGEFFLDNASGLAIQEALQKLTHVRLDRERLTSLDSCHFFLTLPFLTNLYLQENELKSLKGIEMAKHLKFLILSGNQIAKLEGLSSLSKLMVLDVSHNLISEINVEMELPRSLSFLNINENPCCTTQVKLREHLKATLSNLKELDGDALTDDDEGTSSSQDSNSRVNDDDEQENWVDGGDQSYNKETIHINNEERKETLVVQNLKGPCEKLIRVPPIAQKIGTPLTLKRLTLPLHKEGQLHNEGRGHQSMENILDIGSNGLKDLKECLLQANNEPGFVVEKILAGTIGRLDHPTMAMLEQLVERVKNLDVQLSQEIVELFFSARSCSTNSTCNSTKLPKILELYEDPLL